ncbi:MAG: M1 family metallopeptidase, partial [Nocardioidaceae bacterium]
PDNGEPYFDALHYDLVLDWSPSTAELTGTTTLTFRVTEDRDDVQLDFGEPLEVTSASLDDKRIDTTERGEDLVLDTGPIEAESQHTLTIAYAGTPEPVASSSSRPDMPTVGWTTESDGSVWTMQEPWGAYTWYPVNDHPSDKAYYTATVTAQDAMTPVFNGQLEGSERDGRSVTTAWTLDEPAASYLTTIAIGDYTPTEAEGPGGLPLTYWTRPDDDHLLPLLEESPRVLAWLEEQLGPYPFDSGGVVMVPSMSGMETQTLVTLGAAVRPPTDEYLAVLAHEYAHQWLGDTVTPDNWKDLWLNEGLTMYIEALWGDHEGVRSYESQIREWAAVDEANRTTYGPPGEYEKGEFASVNVYLSGAVMLDRIRQEVGDDVFADALRSWPQDHRNGSVDRTDFIEHMSDATGTDLGPFVDEWLTSKTMPTSVS